MQVSIKIYPVANGQISKKDKKQVVALVLDNGFVKNEKTKMYENMSVMAPETVDFWTSKEICENLTFMKPVDVLADISVRGEYLSTRITHIMSDGKYVKVDSKLDEDEEKTKETK